MSNVFKKLSIVVLAVAMMVTAVAPAGAATTEELQAQITALMAQINALNAQLSGTPATTMMTSYTFTRNLTVGSTGADVMELQKLLVSKGHLVLATPTNYFGNMTKAALAKFQAANGISPAVGYFGAITRGSVNGMMGTTPTTPGTPTTPTTPAVGAFTVSLASDTPVAAVVASQTAFNPALKLALQAASTDVKVTSITVRKSGLVANSNITGVDVVDSMGVRHGNVITSLTAENDAVIAMVSEPIVVKAGATEKVTIRFNNAATSGTAQFSIVAASAIVADGTVNGTFPIMGNTMTLQDGSSSVASTTIGVLPINSTGASLNVDSVSAQEITKFRIIENSSKEAVKVSKLTLYNYGNASDTDYKDVELVSQDGTLLATAQPKGQYVTFDLSATPYLIDKGLTKDFTVRAKIVNGATRTIQLAVYNNYDLIVTGVSTGASVLASAAGNDTSFPVGDASNYNKVTISSGSITFGKDSTSPTSATTPGANNVVLATYYAKPTGENMELRKVTLAITKVTTALTGSVYVKVGGAVVYSAAASDISASSTAPTTITLSTYPTLNAGATTLITVEGNISTSAVGTDIYQTYLDLTEAKRVITNDLIDPGVAATQGNAIAVKAAALSVTNLAQPVSASIVPVTNNYEFARFELNASNSGEDVKVTKLIISDNITGAATLANIMNLTMWQGSTQLTTSASTASTTASTTFTFTNPIIVTRTTPVTLSLHGDLVTGTTGTAKFHIGIAATDIIAVGKDTGNSISAPTLTGSGQAMTIAGAGSLTLSAISGASASPSIDQLVKVGTVDGTYLAFQMTAQKEPVKLTTLTLTATGTLATNDVTNIRLYRKVGNNAMETTPFNSAAQMTVTGGATGTYTWTSTDNLLADAIVPGTPVSIYVKADVGTQGSAKLGDKFRFMIASSTTDIAGKGASSASTTLTITGAPSAAGITYISPFSVVVTGTSPLAPVTLGTGSGITIGVFKVENTGTAPITLTDVTLNDGGSATSTLIAYYSTDGNSDVSGGTASSTTNHTLAFGAGAADVTINGGSFRYITVKTNSLSTNNDSYTLSSDVLGNLKYSVAESALGYDADADAALTSTITGLFVDGKPTLATVTSKI